MCNLSTFVLFAFFCGYDFFDSVILIRHGLLAGCCHFVSSSIMVGNTMKRPIGNRDRTFEISSAYQRVRRNHKEGAVVGFVLFGCFDAGAKICQRLNFTMIAYSSHWGFTTLGASQTSWPRVK